MHSALSTAPDIDRVIKETRSTPFSDRITNARIRDIGKIKFPEYAGTTDPRTHVRAFRLAVTKAHLSDYEKEPGYCRFFAENLTGPALEWFASLEGGSIDSFDQVVSVFLKQYSMFIETRATEADLWKLRQGPDEPLRCFIARFKEVKAKIANLNDAVAIDALQNGLWFTSQFKHDLAVRPTSSLDDALHKATFFAHAEEDYSSNLEKYNARLLAAGKNVHTITNSSSQKQKRSPRNKNKFCKKLKNDNEEQESSESEEESDGSLPTTPKSKRGTQNKASQKRRRAEEENDSPPPAFKQRIDMIFKDLAQCGGSTKSVTTQPPAPKKTLCQRLSELSLCRGV
ncbi:unnamed protein product [Microthlaspi erraticum]|uniref:Retrotransposon gag domain-containing protein n=1 Tax=Microthlaspi erraticum TaxID=1685480 RepID=A0A6D2J7R6_9BRAS|nr:unnamed protein product [Microthlaspi erraticum]